MNEPPANAERVFAEAIELPRGEARPVGCRALRNDTALFCEVESHLARTMAQGFPESPPPKPTLRIVMPGALAQSTAMMNPAAHTDVPSRRLNPTGEQVENRRAIAESCSPKRASASGRAARARVARTRAPSPSEHEKSHRDCRAFASNENLARVAGIVYAAHDED